MFSYLVGYIFFVFIISDSLFAQGNSNQFTDTTFHPQVKPTLDVGRRNGAITIDGDLTDEGWQNAAHCSNFTDVMPIPGRKPVVETEALITYDDDYLYIAMIAQDSNPKNIRASLVGRDNIFDDDFMGIILDTYGDASRAFEIYANPLGIQGDLFWTASSEDASYDLIYKSEAKITATGWQLEMRIPFRSLRFPDREEQHFHCCFYRNYPRETVYKMGWASLNFYVPCIFCQFGTLTGISRIHPSGALELLPALVASQSAFPDSTGEHLSNDPIQVSPSLGIRYALGTATDLELALKPDFSQVEADAPQISANTTFALFYPEHRPFFQDGSDLFNTIISAVYTRSINSPLVTAKAIHRDGKTSIAYIGAIDEHTPIIIPLEEKSIILPDVGRSVSNILRATHSFGDNIYVGGLLTDRRYAGDGSNTVFGLDGRAQVYENIELIAQGLWSYTQEQRSFSNGYADTFDENKHSVEFNGEQFSGLSDYIALQRFTSNFDIGLQYFETSPTFRAGNGFIFNNDYRSINCFSRYKFPLINPPSLLKWIVQVNGSFSGTVNWNYEKRQKLQSISPGLYFAFIGQSGLYVTFYRAFTETFKNITFTNLNQVYLGWSTHFAQEINTGSDLSFGHTIARSLDTPSIGKQFNFSLWMRLKPLNGLLLEPSYAFSKLNSLLDDRNYYSGSVYRIRTTYQFSQSLDLRLIVQYNGFAQVLDVDPLLTYKVNPFTSFFIGSTHSYSSPDDTSALRQSERHFFAKVQYLVQ
jgi:hypothetical protein